MLRRGNAWWRTGQSWATDGHKWLNVTHYSGIVIVSESEALRRAIHAIGD